MGKSEAQSGADPCMHPELEKKLEMPETAVTLDHVIVAVRIGS